MDHEKDECVLNVTFLKQIETHMEYLDGIDGFTKQYIQKLANIKHPRWNHNYNDNFINKTNYVFQYRHVCTPRKERLKFSISTTAFLANEKQQTKNNRRKKIQQLRLPADHDDIL